MTGKPELAVDFDNEIYYPFNAENRDLFLHSPERYTVDQVPTWPRSVVLFVGGEEEGFQALVQNVAARLSNAESARVKAEGQPPITYCCPPAPQFPEVSSYLCIGPHPQLPLDPKSRPGLHDNPNHDYLDPDREIELSSVKRCTTQIY